MQKRFFKLGLLALIILMLAAAITSSASAADSAKTGQGTIFELQGTAQMLKVGSTSWVNATVNTVLKPGDQIKTSPESCCIILLWDGSVVKLGENTHLLLKSLSGDESKNSSKFKLFLGKIWSQVNKVADKKTEFEVEAPHALAAVRGTVFDVTSDGNDTDLSVFEGTVNVNDGAKEMNLARNRWIRSDRNGLAKNFFNIDRNKLNEWQQWNLKVDDEIEKNEDFKLWKHSAGKRVLDAKTMLKIREAIKKHGKPLSARHNIKKIERVKMEKQINRNLKEDMRNRVLNDKPKFNRPIPPRPNFEHGKKHNK